MGLLQVLGGLLRGGIPDWRRSPQGQRGEAGKAPGAWSWGELCRGLSFCDRGMNSSLERERDSDDRGECLQVPGAALARCIPIPWAQTPVSLTRAT